MTMFDSALRSFIEALHAAPHRAVIEFAGAGVQALAWLHGVGGSSNTILEATDRYSSGSMIELLGEAPAKFVTPTVAQKMAQQAYLRAYELTDQRPLLGVGCTATIATNRPKRGQHRVCIAVCSDAGLTDYQLTLTKGQRGRTAEEAVVSRLLLQALGRACQITPLPALPLLDSETVNRHHEAADLLAQLLAGGLPLVIAQPAGALVPARQLPDVALFSGSFNPLHQGHRRLAHLAHKRLKRPLYFELPLVNADKTPLSVAEARRRLAQFEDSPVVLTCAPLFSQKAQLFPGAVFVIGGDTASRLIEPRFYGDSHNQMKTALDEIRRAGCRFLAAGRLHQGRFLTVADLDIPDGYRDLFMAIPESEFREDVSSTEIRQQDG